MRLSTIVALLLALLVGASSLLHGLGFMRGFNTSPLPALARLAKDARVHVPSEHRGRVTLVLVDGLRADFASHLGLDSQAGAAAASCQLDALLPSFSRPAYVALSTGVPPWASGVHTNDHEGPVALPSIWEMARAAGVPTRLVSDGTDWWTELFPAGFDQISVVPARDFDSFWDAFVKLPVPASALTLVHIVGADDAAHDFGTGAAYVAEIARAGAKIRQLVAALDPARDTLLVAADHGHIARGGHGGPEPEVMATPLFAFGAGAVPIPGAGLGDGTGPWCGSLIDLAATIAARLDIAPPACSMGGIVPVIRPADPSFSIEAQSSAVHDALGGAAFDAVAQARTRPVSIRGLAFAALLWLALVLMLARLAVVGGKLRCVVSALAAPLLFAGAYALFEPTLSLSAVWLEDPWTLRLTAVAAAAGLCAAAVVHRRHAPAEALLLLTAGAGLPWMLAVFAHGSTAAAPVLGDPHAAFAIVVADIFAAASLAAGLLVTAYAFARERRRARARVWV